MYKFFLASFFLINTSVFAEGLPFQPTPKGFEAYLNKTSWEDGKKRVFRNLRVCKDWRNVEYMGFVANAYGCEYGYVEIKDPIYGKRFCELQQMYTPSYFKGEAVSYWEGELGHGTPSPCRN